MAKPEDPQTHPQIEREASLEAKLSERPHTDMELMQFAAITGLSDRWRELYEPIARRIHEDVARVCRMRRRPLSHRQKLMEARISGTFEYLQYGKSESIRTIGQFRTWAESHYAEINAHGPDLRRLSVVDLLYLNSVLTHFGLSPISVLATRSEEERLKAIGPYVPPAPYSLRSDNSSRTQ